MAPQLHNEVFQVITDVTGHEIECLELDLHLEANLGIDSIKQIGVLQRIVELIPESLRDRFVNEGVPDTLRGMETLGDLLQCINSWLQQNHPESAVELNQSSVTETADSNSLVLNIIAEITGFKVDELEPDMRLDQDLGIDSIKQISLINRLGVALATTDENVIETLLANGTVMAAETIHDLVEIINQIASQEHQHSHEECSAVVFDHNMPATGVPVVYAQYQHIIAHYAMDSTSLCSHLEIRGPLDINKLQTAWQQVVDRHPALRLTLGGMADAQNLSQLVLQEYTDTHVPAVELTDLQGQDKADQNAAIDTEMSELLMRGWNVEQWPLHSLRIFKLGEQRHQLFLSIHHLISDGLGNQIILRELLAIYDSLDGGPIAQLVPALSMAEYIDAVEKMNLADDANNPEKLQKFVKQQGKEQFKWHPDGQWRKSPALQMQSRLFKLDAQETQNLQAQLAQLRISLNSILVATLLRVASRSAKYGGRMFVNIPTSGRIYEEIEVLGTVSDFAQNIVMDFDCANAQGDWPSWARSVHDNIQDALGHGYDRLMIKQVAEVANDIALQDGNIPTLQRQVLSAGIKSNLYLSCVGECGIQANYKNIDIKSYHPATVTVRGGVDNLVELFDGQLLWSINYDASVITEDIIQQFGDDLMQELRQVSAEATVAQTSATEKQQIASPDENVVQNIKDMMREILHCDLSDDDFVRDLETELGLNSLQRIRLTMRLRRSWPDVDPANLLKCRTLNDIIRVIPAADYNCDEVSSLAQESMAQESITPENNAPSIQSDIPIQNKNAACDAISSLIKEKNWTSIHSVVVAQCKKTPDAIAIKDGDRRISYGELDRKSNQLAHYLNSQGVERNKLVGVMMDRGVDMIIAILGALKAGAAYVPLDTGYPVDRLRYILKHSETSWLLTQVKQHELVSQVFNGTELSVISYLDDEPPMDAGLSVMVTGPSVIQSYTEEALDIDTQPTDPMTVLYTSGSTGKPKGVLLAHAGYLNRIQWMSEALNITETDRIAFKTSCCFDISVWEIFLPLMYGATQVAVERDVVSNPWALSEWMNKECITVMHFVPSLFGEFLSVTEEEGFHFSTLRWLVFSGEALPVNFVRRWMKKYGNRVNLTNLYGPTEASIDVTAHMIEQQPGADEMRIPIGKPLPNTSMLVLNDDMQPCAVGEIGELYIAGVQLAKGYLKDTENTAKAFLHNPFDDIPGDRIYRTGDLAAWLDDGSIDYRGRKDSQVKIRGFRIELGEVESVLQSHPAVSEAVVIVCDKGDDNKYLAAAIHPESSAPDVSELRAFVSKSLPDYMIPSQFDILADIPRNHNGKIDRNKLKQYFTGEKKTQVLPATTTPDVTYSLAPAQRWLVRHFAPTHFWAGVHQFRYLDELDSQLFERALAAVVQHHSALRTVFIKHNGELRQRVHAQNEISIENIFYDGRHLTSEALSAEIDNLTNGFKDKVNLEQWPLWRITCIRDSETSYVIHIVGHHLICDMLSSTIIFRDLWQAYCNLLAGEATGLGKEPRSMLDMVRILEQADQKQQLQAHEAYWCNQFPSAHARFQVPLDYIHGRNDENSLANLHVSLDLDVSSQLMSAGRKCCGVSLYPIMLAALYRGLSGWTNTSWVVVSHRSHGRSLGEGQHFLDAVGDFAVNYPLGMNIDNSEAYVQLIKRISQELEAVPMKGISYDYLGDRLPEHVYPDDKLTSVRANYLGNRTQQNSSLFEYDETVSDKRLAALDSERTTLIEFTFATVNGEIVLDISYSNNFHSQASIEAIAGIWQNNMFEMLEQIKSNRSLVAEIM